MTNLVKLEGGQPVNQMSKELAEKLVAAVNEYADRIPLAAAIGVLSLVQKQIIEDAE